MLASVQLASTASFYASTFNEGTMTMEKSVWDSYEHVISKVSDRIVLKVQAGDVGDTRRGQIGSKKDDWS